MLRIYSAKKCFPEKHDTQTPINTEKLFYQVLSLFQDILLFNA